MTNEQYLKNLSVPTGMVDAVIDTDTFNEIDDQFAVSFMLLLKERINTKAIYAAPFFNSHSTSPEDGMQKSYDEILKLLHILKMDDFNCNVYKGSKNYLPDESTPVISDAARHLAELAKSYSPDKPLYVISIGAITNVASALLIDPSIAENIVIVWLGGNSLEMHNTLEFNMRQDIAAARVVMSSAAPFVQLPCDGVVSQFSTTGPELKFWLYDKTPIADYLARNTVREAESYAAGRPWSRVIWDVTAVAWLLNDNDRYMMSRVQNIRLPEYDGHYSNTETGKLFRYVYFIRRDPLIKDLFNTLLAEGENK